MKKVLKISFLILIITLSYQMVVYAENEDILESQKESLNLSDFVSEAQKYVDQNLEGIDVQALITSAITGKIEDENLLKSVFNILGKEVKDAIKVMREYSYSNLNT